jgi:two-component system OmpR family response regulator
MKLLVVEDNVPLAVHIKAALTAAHFAVDHVGDGEEAHYLGAHESYDAVVLDLGLPVLDGLSVLRRWRSEGRGMPVLILTARGAWTEKVAGLNAGADDYLAKPFAMEELVARLHALLRRAKGRASPEIIHGALQIDPATAAVTWQGVPVRLTDLEYRLLAYLAQHGARFVTKTELSEQLYGREDSEPEFNTLEVIVARIRRKTSASVIETVRGRGYRLLGLQDG